LAYRFRKLSFLFASLDDSPFFLNNPFE